MCRLSHCRWLPAVAVFVALPLFSVAQLAFRDSAAAVEENTAAAADLPSSPPAASPLIQLPHEEMGDIYSARQRYQAALAEYKLAQPRTSVTWNKMAIAYQMFYDSKDAIRCYRESIRLNKHDPRVYNNLATVYDSLKDFKEGERNYRKALKLNPNSSLTLKNLGTNLLLQHKYKEGQAAFSRALLIEPDVYQVHGGPTVNGPSSARDRGMANYFQALSCARAALTGCALERLRRAVNEGAVSAKKMAAETDLAPLRGLPEFQKLLAIAR